MPRGRGIYLDEPSDKAHTQADKQERSVEHENTKDIAPDEQAREHAQEPPD